MMRILVTNDDGYEAAGIRELVKGLSKLEDAEVLVCAPAGQRSATSQSITFRKDIIVEEISMEGAAEAFSISGMPADCVRWGVQHYRALGKEIDFVFSGMNLGNNTGMSIHYSGTVSAAKEGALNNIRSIAISVNSHDAVHFEYPCMLLPEIIEASKLLPKDVILSINSPNIPASEIKGVKLVPMAPCGFGEDFVYKKTGEGSYRLGVERTACDSTLENDWNAVESGYVAISPLATNVNHEDALMAIQGLSNEKSMCVLIDFQEKLVPAMHKEKRLLNNLKKFAKCLKILDVPVLLTEQYSKGLGYTVPEVTDSIGRDFVVEKNCFSCLLSEEFMDTVCGMTSKKVVLAGIESHICLQQTALDFLMRGYEVMIISDCCMSRSEHNHKMAMELLRAKGCVVTTWESYIYGLLKTSKHPKFKEISAVVKEDDEEDDD